MPESAEAEKYGLAGVPATGLIRVQAEGRNAAPFFPKSDGRDEENEMTATRKVLARSMTYREIWEYYFETAPERRAWVSGIAEIKLRQEAEEMERDAEE